MVENKCYKCAELEGCWVGKHGEGKANCKCYCPCYSKDSCIIVEKSDKGIRLIDRTKMEVLCEGNNLSVEQILNALGIDFRHVFLNENRA